MPLKKHVKLLKQRKRITGFSGYRLEKSNLFCFASYRLFKVVLLLLLELAYLAGRNVCPRGIHHSNPSVRCAGEQLVPGRTNIGGNFFLSYLSLLSFFPLFFFIRLILLSLIENKTLLKVLQYLYLLKGIVLCL